MKWFCSHNWSAWSEMVTTYDAPFQYRYCEKCNLIKKIKAATNGNSVNLLAWNNGQDKAMLSATNSTVTAGECDE